VKPERHKFSTKVSDAIANVYPILKDNEQPSRKRAKFNAPNTLLTASCMSVSLEEFLN